MRRIAVLAALLVFLCVVSTSGDPTVEWVKAFDGIGDPYSLQQTADGGYVLLGEALLKISASGDEEWRSLEAGSLAGEFGSASQLSEGGYVVVGTGPDDCQLDQVLSLVRTNPTGTVLWDREIALTLDHLAMTSPMYCTLAALVFELEDGSLLLFVGSYSVDIAVPLAEHRVQFSFSIAKTDSAGAKLWERTLASWSQGEAVQWIVGFEEDKEGNLVFLKTEELFSNPLAQVLEVTIDSNSGVELGVASYEPDGNLVEYFLSPFVGIFASDGDGSVAGISTVSSGQESGVDLVISSYSSLEELDWEVQVRRAGDQAALAIQQTFDGGFIALGSEESQSGETTTLLVKLSADDEAPIIHTVSTPHQPSGPTDATEVDQQVDFTISGSTCSQGHAVQYRFDWDDVSGYSDWSSATTALHSYEQEGIYAVRAQARCSDQTAITSDWSVPYEVRVEDSKPSPYLGPVANAGPDREYSDSNSDGIEIIALDGSSSFGQGYGITHYIWTTGGQAIANTSQPLVELGQGEHIIILMVEDETGLTATDTVTVTILPKTDEPSTANVESLARIIVSESSVGNDIEQECVGWTVLNRFYADHYYGPGITVETIEDVVNPGGNWGPQYAYNQEPTEAYRVLARELLRGEIPDRTKGCTNLFSPRGATELQDTSGKDIGGGLFLIPEPTSDGWDGSLQVYFPSWGANVEMSGSNANFTHEFEHETHEWIEIEGVEHNNYFMFYRPRILELSAKIGSPGELRAYDAQGRVTGLVDGRVLTDIPGSSYSNDEIVIHSPAGTVSFEVAGTKSGTYSLILEADSGGRSFTVTSMPITEGAVHLFSVRWLQVGQEHGVVISLDNDGDGDFEQFLEVGETLDGEQLDTPPVAPPSSSGEVTCGPNPVSDSGTAFFYSLPIGVANPGIKVFDITGQLVFETAVDLDLLRFPATGPWMPVDSGGIPLANGPYVYVLIADGRVIGQGKMVIQR